MSDLIGEAWTHTGYAERLHFGAGVVARLPEIVKELGIRRALFVTTEGRAESEDGVRITKLLGRSIASRFTEVRSHVPTTLVQAAMQQARRDAVDGVVSFGGGSCADLGKAVSYFTEQEAELLARRSRSARVAAHRDPYDLLRRRAHAVLRDDR